MRVLGYKLIINKKGIEIGGPKTGYLYLFPWAIKNEEIKELNRIIASLLHKIAEKNQALKELEDELNGVVFEYCELKKKLEPAQGIALAPAPEVTA
jgi:hypothetical protein